MIVSCPRHATAFVLWDGYDYTCINCGWVYVDQAELAAVKALLGKGQRGRAREGRGKVKA